MKTKPFNTYVINLASREDRKKSILLQLNGKDEFNISIVNASQRNIGAIGLWETIQHILRDLVNKDDEFIILCEDDHQFTPAYSSEKLFSCIEGAKEKNADIVVGGISGFTTALQASENLFWVEKFSGLQFAIIFRKFFQAILKADFTPGDAADYKMCSLTDNKFFIYPFISVQKDFGYSDVTPKNNQIESITKLFDDAGAKIRLLNKVHFYYSKYNIMGDSQVNNKMQENVTIPTYVINLPEREDRKMHIENQFREKTEFEINFIQACKHTIGAVGLWKSIRMITKTAIMNEDDVIIICEDDHTFSSHYRMDRFMKNIFQAYELGCNILMGGVSGFEAALQITEDLWWINSFWSTQFVVVFKRFFQAILNESFTETDTADGKFSEMTSQKMVIFPFISIQNDFGYSDVTKKNNEMNGLITRHFEDAHNRLSIIQKISEKYKRSKQFI